MKLDSAAVKQEIQSDAPDFKRHRKMGRLRLRHAGPAVTLVFFIVLVGIFRAVGISLHFSFLVFLGLYLSIGVQSVAYAVLLLSIEYPKELVFPSIRRLARRPEIIVIGLALGVLFLRLLPAGFAFLFLIAVMSLFAIPWKSTAQVLFPGFYLFFGLLTAFAYNVVAVTLRFEPNYDHVLQRLDSYLLFGHSVSELSHKLAAAVPAFVPEAMLFMYAAMFAQIGAALMLCSMLVDRNYAMKFVSAILLSYLITVAIFFALPTHSPYFSCVNHGTARLPQLMLQVQRQFVEMAEARWHGSREPLGVEYYVSFPCMHITQPLIAMWFLRRWRRMTFILAGINILLAFSIVFLEWHYLVDLLGGVAVATLAILVVDRWPPLLKSAVSVT